MKSSPTQVLCTAALLCLALAAPPPADAGPLKSIGSSLKKLNPFRKTEEKPPAALPPAPKPKPTAAKTAKTTKAAPVKKKKIYTSTTKKSTAAAAGTAAGDATKPTPDGTEPSATTPETTPDAVVDANATPAADSPPAAPAEIPFGTPVMGRKGHVRSPYAEDQGMVDVTDIPAGAKVKCPFTGKVFRVP